MVYEKLGNIYDLENEVVYTDLCCYCGACGAFCKEYITYENQQPTTKKKCYEAYGACYEFCSRTSFSPFDVERSVFGETREDNVLGYHRDIIAARSTDEQIRARVQDGGIVSALLIHLFEKGEIDSAITSKVGETSWMPEPFIATTSDDVLASAGSKYSPCPSILGVGDAIEQGYENIAFVGLPCHVQSMRNIQTSKDFDVDIDRVKTVIGLFCMESFDLDVLAKVASDEGVRIEDIKKFDIHKGKFYMITDEKEVTVGIKKMREYARDACKVCYDFASEFADISVGSIGTARGWNTVITRSDAGKELFKSAEDAGLIETTPLNNEGVKELRDIAMDKKRENLERILAESDPAKILNLSIEPERLRDYLAV